MASPVGLEPTTTNLEDSFSIQLKYREFARLVYWLMLFPSGLINTIADQPLPYFVIMYYTVSRLFCQPREF